MPKLSLSFVGPVVVLVLVSGLAFWTISERKETERQEEARQIKLKEETAQASAKATALKRKEQTVLIGRLSDEGLLALYQDCEKRVTELITNESKPSFSVHFPMLSNSDFAPLSEKLFRDIRIEALKRVGALVGVVAQSASDSLGGVKKWVAVYECELDGVNIKSVSRRGQRRFLN